MELMRDRIENMVQVEKAKSERQKRIEHGFSKHDNYMQELRERIQKVKAILQPVRESNERG